MSEEANFRGYELLKSIHDATLNDLARRCLGEFGDVADYIWKSPRLLEVETRLEKRKLAAYFPLGDGKERNSEAIKLRAYRWAHENRKLTDVFPYLIATGNLFSSISLFETYCLMLCKEAEKRTGKMTSMTPGSGARRLFAYLRSVGIDQSKAELREQVDASTKIRNCVFHASGLLAWSKDEEFLRTIVSKRLYLSPFHRDRRLEADDWDDEIEIVQSALGQRLQVTNHYCFILTSYLRNHFVDLCCMAQSHI